MIKKKTSTKSVYRLMMTRLNAPGFRESEGERAIQARVMEIHQRKEKQRCNHALFWKKFFLDTKVVMKTRPCPKSRKKEPTAFGNIKPNASSPPPPMGVDVTTEDEEKQGSSTRPSSTMETAVDIANLDDFSVDSAASIKTSASGAFKRTKKTISSRSKRMRNKEEQQDYSSSSEEEESGLQDRKRKQGRPVTTGEGV